MDKRMQVRSVSLRGHLNGSQRGKMAGTGAESMIIINAAPAATLRLGAYAGFCGTALSAATRGLQMHPHIKWQTTVTTCMTLHACFAMDPV